MLAVSLAAIFKYSTVKNICCLLVRIVVHTCQRFGTTCRVHLQSIKVLLVPRVMEGVEVVRPPLPAESKGRQMGGKTNILSGNGSFLVFKI
jgi:hypothetical protein